MWNRKVLSKPPVCDVMVEVTKESKGLLNNARNHCKKALSVTDDHLRTLSTEHFVLKRIVYKLGNQFRSEKSMRGLKQMKSCLNRLIDLEMPNLIRGVEDIVKLCPSTSGDSVYLPSRQVLQFNLVRLMGVAGLLTQLAHYSTATFVHVKQHLEIGNMIPQNVLMLALSSRIWYVSKSLCNYTCQWYKVLLPCEQVLQPTQVPWLPETEVLPEDLPAWLLATFDKPNCLKTERDMTKAANTLLNTEEEIEEITGAASSFICTEDIGEAVKRQPLPASCHESLNTESATNKSDCIDERDALLDLSTATLETMPASGNVRKYVKQLLKSQFKTVEDVIIFKNSVSSAKNIKLGSFCIRLSKMGKKKILKKISLYEEHLNQAHPKFGHKQLETLCGVLSSMISKYSKKENTAAPDVITTKVEQADERSEEECMMVDDDVDDNNSTVQQSTSVIDSVKIADKKAKHKVKKNKKNKDKLLPENLKHNVKFCKKINRKVKKKISR